MRLFSLVVLSFVLACSNSEAPQPMIPQLQIAAGNNQTAAVGKELPSSVGALLSDKTTGTPLPGRVVNWLVVSGGGAVFAGATETGTNGVASQRWTLGGQIGEQRLVARWVDPETGQPFTIDTAKATAVADVAMEFHAVFGGPSNLAVNDVGIIEYWFEDDYGNTTTLCLDAGSPDRITWVSDDPSSLEVQAGVLTRPNGRHAVTVKALKPKMGIAVMGTPDPKCSAAIPAGVIFNVS